MDRRLAVPVEVRDTARKALLAQPPDVPEVTYRLASGWALPGDRPDIALWSLDNTDQYTDTRCTLTAALRGGRAGMRWAMTAALTGIVDPLLVEAQLAETVRSDQMLVPQIAAAIATSWDRMLDHAGRKARLRLMKSGVARRIEFKGWPNAEAARAAGVDDLVDTAWDALVITLTGLFAGYARTQAALVETADPLSAEIVHQAINSEVAAAVNALVAFLDLRARQFLTGEVVYAPATFDIARVVGGWVSGAGGKPTGFTVDALVEAQFVTGTSTAQVALLGLLVTNMERTFTWIHGFYGAPLKPFIPHLEMDGQTFTESEFGSLSVEPGDHVGCLCEVVPGWTAA